MNPSRRARGDVDGGGHVTPILLRPDQSSSFERVFFGLDFDEVSILRQLSRPEAKPERAIHAVAGQMEDRWEERRP